MRRTRMLMSAAVLAALLPLAGCSVSFPDPPATVGDDFPAYGIPTQVTWPSDRIGGLSSTGGTGDGAIVGLRLEYLHDRWVWRVTSGDPGRDWLDERVVDPSRGKEAIVDATDHELLQHRRIELSEAQLARVEVGADQAARLSGEVYPSPRLIELELVSASGGPAWRAVLYDTETGEQTVLMIDAMGSGVEPRPSAKP